MNNVRQLISHWLIILDSFEVERRIIENFCGPCNVECILNKPPVSMRPLMLSPQNARLTDRIVAVLGKRNWDFPWAISINPSPSSSYSSFFEKQARASIPSWLPPPFSCILLLVHPQSASGCLPCRAALFLILAFTFHHASSSFCGDVLRNGNFVGGLQSCVISSRIHTRFRIPLCVESHKAHTQGEASMAKCFSVAGVGRDSGQCGHWYSGMGIP